MIVNQQALSTLYVGFSTAFNKGFHETPTYYDQIATTVPSNTREQNYAWLGQMPRMREWIGEREKQKMLASSYSILNKHFEMTVTVNRDDIEDDTYGVTAPWFSNMGECAKTHPDELVFQALMSGFENKCYDEKPFFASDHKNGKITYSNLGSEKLSETSYLKGRTSIMSLVGDNGKSLNLIPDLLVVSPTNEMEARRILEADMIDGSTNILKGTAKILVVPMLAEKKDQWYLLCTNKFLKPIIYQVRTPIKLVKKTNDTDDNVFMQNEFVYGADGRCNVGYGFPQMAYGSTGTTAG